MVCNYDRHALTDLILSLLNLTKLYTIFLARLRHRYSKAAKRWNAGPVKAKKEYLYIAGLMADIVEEKLYYVPPEDSKAVPLPGSPAKLKKSVASIPKPSFAVLQSKFEDR